MSEQPQRQIASPWMWWFVTFAILFYATSCYGDTYDARTRTAAAKVASEIVDQPILPDAPPNVRLSIKRMSVAAAGPEVEEQGVCPEEASVLISINGRLHGSGVYVMYHGVPLLLTAAHVVEEHREPFVIKAGDAVAQRVLVDHKTDIAVLYAGHHAAIELAPADPARGDAVTTWGMDRHSTLTEVEDVVTDVLTNSGWRDLPGIACQTFPPLGRSGGGLFRNGALVGVLHFRDPVPRSGVYSRLATLRSVLERVNLSGRRRAVVYTGEDVHGSNWCVNCPKLKAALREGNDALDLTYSRAVAPGDVQLYPAVRFVDLTGTECYPARLVGGKLEYHTVASCGELLEFIERSNPPCQIPAPVAGMGGRRQEQREQQGRAALSIQGRDRVVTAIAYAKQWVPDSEGVTDLQQLADATVSLTWQRNGVSKLPLLAAEKWTSQQLFGTHGHFRFITPKGSTAVREFGTGYQLRTRPDGGETVHLTPDPVDIDLLAPGEAPSSSGEACGFDPITLGLTVINVISGLWQLAHPEFSLTLGSDVEVTGRISGESLLIGFNSDCPSIEAKAWFLRATLRVTSVEVSPERVRFRFEKNWTGITQRDLIVE